MIALRPAQFPDYTSIAKLHAESWRQNYRGIYNDNFLDNEVEQNRSDTWHKRLKFPDPNQYVTVAVFNEGIVGFSCILLNDDPAFGSLLDNLHVLSDLQNTGIGRSLMKDCAKTILNKANNNKMYLWVYEVNKNARAVYERLGGTCYEIAVKQNEDGTHSSTCRYIWNDVSALI
jgi:GNAT superfamily N-acetyltransferase